MINCYCSRCGKYCLDENGKLHFTPVFLPCDNEDSMWTGFGGEKFQPYDLCDDCLEILKRWIYIND